MLRMFARWLSLFLILILLTACSSNTFTFSGDTDNWEADLKVIQHDNGFEDQNLRLHYKGKDVNSVGEVTYDIDTDAGGFGGGGLKLNEYGNLEGSSQANETNAKISRTSDVMMTVEWDGNKEKLTLTRN